MSFWGKLGKVALKAAPIAAGFIPGVGPLASMAIGAGTAGLSKKLEGGSLKDSLLSGAVGGATGYASGKLGDMTTSKPGGIGPSSYVNKSVTGISDRIGKLGDGSALQHIGQAAGTAAKTGLGKKIALSALGAAPALAGLSALPQLSRGKDDTFGPGVYGGDSGGDFGSFEYRNPNIGAALQRGRKMAIGPSRY